jgi:glutamine amidotransferase-like uncharacterized protein
LARLSIMESSSFRADGLQIRLRAKAALYSFPALASIFLISILFAACNAHSNQVGMPTGPGRDSEAAKSVTAAQILLFNGTGSSPNDVAAIEAILKSQSLPYATANSAQLNAMTEVQIHAYRLLIVPGGNFVDIGNGLTSDTAANIRTAVQHGLNYLGICGGAFVAGDSPYNGLNLTSGVRFGFYSAESKGIRKTAVSVTDASGASLDQYWEDGPQLTGWGAVVAKYPDGTPAVVEGAVADGWVILAGVHPEAPENWRRGLTFHTPASADNEYAGMLIHAALNGESLPHY